ncbi:MAG: four helix bundle protein [Acidobacteriota bacterium]|nr:four helix bundle protein [Acidobacteriota bacterium]
MWVGEGASGPTLSKSFDFALVIIKLYKELQDRREYVLSKQLLRSGTSVGANIEEAGAASSRRDFLYKMTIASKEARETAYWLRLLDASGLVGDLDVKPQLEKANELVRLLTAIVKTTKKTTP